MYVPSGSSLPGNRYPEFDRWVPGESVPGTPHRSWPGSSRRPWPLVDPNPSHYYPSRWDAPPNEGGTPLTPENVW